MDKKTALKVFSITEKESLAKPIWRHVGTAFVNRDGSMNVLFDALPVSGKVQIREDTPQAEAFEQS